MPGHGPSKRTHRRWRVIGLISAVTFVAYMDRVNFTVAIPAIRDSYHLSLHEIGLISFAWTISYAICGFPGGWIADRLGLRAGMAGSLAWWSLFTIASPFSGGLLSWMALRALMGAGEAPIWSYNAKAADDWVAPDERSTAYGIGGSGEFLGPAVGALLSGWIASTLGWRWSFVLFGLFGIVLLAPWILLVRNDPESDPGVGAAERERIGVRRRHGGADWAGLKAVVLSRVGIGLLITYVTNGYVLFTFKNWVPTYMHEQFGASVMGGAAWASLSSGLGFVGFLLAGPINDALVRRTDRLRARRIGVAVPASGAIACLLLSAWTAGAHIEWATATLIGGAQFLTTITAGAWAVSVIDLSPGRGSTGILYGFFNGSLNLMGAANALVITAIATRFGFPAAFGSAIGFILVFMAAMLWVVDRPGYRTAPRQGGTGSRSKRIVDRRRAGAGAVRAPGLARRHDRSGTWISERLSLAWP